MKSGAPMQRKTPLRSTKPMARGAGFRPVAETKPAKGEPRQKKCAVKGCQEKYTPDPKRPFVRWCNDEHALVLALAAIEAKKRAKNKERRVAASAERREDGERRENLKSYPQLVKEAQREFNAFVRLRDARLPCICCGKRFEDKSLTAGNVHAGHYRSTGSAPHLRFNEDNVHLQNAQCNLYGAGRAVDYRIGLIARIGLERVEALEANNQARKWTHDELREIRDTYRRRVREMKKEAACNP